MSLPFKLKFNELHFCKLYRQLFIMDKIFSQSVKSKNARLSGFRIVGKTLLKSLSIFVT